MSEASLPERPAQILTPTQWRSHFTAWEATTLSKAEYCRVHGLPKGSFYYWYRKLQRSSVSPDPASHFIKVVSKDVAVESPPLHILMTLTPQIQLTLDLTQKQLIHLIQKSIDGLSYLVSQNIKHPIKEGVFLFLNRKRDKLKCLSWHKNGFILLYKRLEKDLFSKPPSKTEGVIELNREEMSWLLAGLEWPKMRDWQELNYDKFS